MPGRTGWRTSPRRRCGCRNATASASSPTRVGTSWRESSGMKLSETGPAQFDSANRLADAVIARVGKTIVLAMPLGLGKANHVANALFARAVADPSIRLRIFTALTLEKPHPSSELERRFIGPIAERCFGGYPDLAYAVALRKGLPPNVEG